LLIKNSLINNIHRSSKTTFVLKPKYMKKIIHNPTDDIYPATPEYVHAVEIQSPQRLLYLSGTMGLGSEGTPGEDVNAQLSLTWHNIRTILKSADMTTDNIVRVTSYLRDGTYADANAAARMEALGGRPVATIVIIAQTLSPEWLVEIEVVAAD
jgi:2-iminobutanoate/2-iminopropanoate deaminase